MPNILFASNSISHFPGSYARNEEWSFDANRVPYAVYIPPATIASTPVFPASTTNETWFHFRAGAFYWYVNNLERICEIVDIEGKRIALLACHDRTSQGYHLDVVTDTQTDQLVKWIPVANAQLRTFDIRVRHTALELQVDLYINELLLLTKTFSVAAEIVPRSIRMGGATGDHNDVGLHFSELIVSDSDTRNARLDLLRPVSAGVYENWDGPLSSLADDDPTTGMTTTLADQSQSTILTPYTGANNISNVVQVSTTVRGINSPEHLQHLIRMSGVDYLTADFTLPYAKDFQVTDWKLNPATSLPWAATDLDNVEFGFKSIA